jgi:hypothetical protein
MKIKTSRLNVRKYTFVVRIVEIWNSLPESVIQAKTVKQFEIGLDEHWKHQDHHGGVFVAIKKWTIQRNWQHRIHNTTKNTTQNMFNTTIGPYSVVLQRLYTRISLDIITWLYL